MDLDRYQSDDLNRDQRQLEALKTNLVNLLRIKYTAIIALLVSAFYNKNPFITLFPFLITVVIFFIEVTYRKKICRNAAYLIVFYGQEFAPEWELRFHEYRKKSLKITRAKEFLKNFSKIKAPKFLKYKILRWLDRSIVRFFFLSLGESSSIQNFYIVELLFTAISFGVLFFNYLTTLSFPISYMIVIYIISAIFCIFIIKVCLFFGKVLYYYKIDYEKEIDVWIGRWSKVKSDEKLKAEKELLSKFKSGYLMTQFAKELAAKNLNSHNSSLELLNSSLQLEIKNIVLTRLLKSDPDYKELSSLIDVWKKL